MHRTRLMTAFLTPVAIVSLSSCGINSIPTAEENAKARWADVQNQYQRRADLIPNLVETVKGYAAHEKSTFQAITSARAAMAGGGGGVAATAAADAQMTGLIGRLFAVAEQYPQLRATENFQQLQTQLEDTEQKIAISRQVYNDTVLSYNNATQTVPTNVIAGIFNFGPRDFFEIEQGAREAPQVRF